MLVIFWRNVQLTIFSTGLHVVLWKLHLRMCRKCWNGNKRNHKLLWFWWSCVVKKILDWNQSILLLDISEWLKSVKIWKHTRTYEHVLTFCVTLHVRVVWIVLCIFTCRVHVLQVRPWDPWGLPWKMMTSDLASWSLFLGDYQATRECLIPWVLNGRWITSCGVCRGSSPCWSILSWVMRRWFVFVDLAM